MTSKVGDVQRSPSVQYITGIIEQRIRHGEYRRGQWLPTERALAEEFQVSRATVRQSLGALEEDGFLRRANGCRPLVCTPEADDVSHARTGRRNVGLWLTSDPADPGAYRTLQGIQRALDPETFRLVMASPARTTLAGALQSEARFLARMAEEDDIAGVILWYLGGDTNRPGLEALRAANIPMVFVDRRPPDGFPADYVEVDNEGAARETVAHLIAQGHRRIAHITNPETACTVAERRAGYRLALEEANIAFDPKLVLIGDFMEAAEDGSNHMHEALVERLMSLPDPPTAVFAVNDYSALALVAALKAYGVSVPEEMAVAGFDDLERWTPGVPFLTTVRQPFERMGAEAVKLLRRRIETGPTQTYRHVMLDAPLIVRGSTSANDSGHRNSERRTDVRRINVEARS